MQASRDEIIKFCKDYLKTDNFHDHCENGLQVDGSEKVFRILGGVSLSVRLIQAAIHARASMIIVHHGLFRGDLGENPRIAGHHRQRLALLLKHDISLCGFHLPLDAHPLTGNNVSLCRLLKLRNLKPLNVGFVGKLKQPLPLAALSSQIGRLLNSAPQLVIAGSHKISRLAVISGGSSTYFTQAAEAGADALLCGDLKEHIVRAAEENQIHIINAGHYNTEKLGIINLGKILQKKFKIPFEFIDIPCEV